MLLVADLVQYWTHRAYHEIPFLWRFHAVHHSAKHMDWMAGSRLHLFELLTTRVSILGVLYVLGFTEAVDERLHRHRRLPGRVQPRQCRRCRPSSPARR